VIFVLPAVLKRLRYVTSTIVTCRPEHDGEELHRHDEFYDLNAQ